jgi:hypothetical protein
MSVEMPLEELDLDPCGGDREIPTDPIPLGDDEQDNEDDEK